jgi:uncharacterized membrane protein YkoI
MNKSLLIAYVLAPLVAVSLAAPVRAQALSGLFDSAPSNALLSMEDILTRAREAASGTITGVELERERGKWIYEVETRTPEGREIELKYDARTGDLLSRRGARK